MGLAYNQSCWKRIGSFVQSFAGNVCVWVSKDDILSSMMKPLKKHSRCHCYKAELFLKLQWSNWECATRVNKETFWWIGSGSTAAQPTLWNWLDEASGIWHLGCCCTFLVFYNTFSWLYLKFNNLLYLASWPVETWNDHPGKNVWVEEDVSAIIGCHQK